MPEARGKGLPLKLLWGMVGVLLACTAADINQQVTSVALADIRGSMGFGVGGGSWIETLYTVGEAMGMMVAPWCMLTFSVRYLATIATLALALTGVLCAVVTSNDVFLVLRWCQGLSNGFLIPLLMAVALRFLTPTIKLYGLAAYGLTATFAPNFAAPFVAWAHQYLGVSFLYVDILPFCLIAAVLILYGLPRDPINLGRFAQFDWRGLILGWTASIFVVVALTQGERLDWLDSSMVRLFLAALVIVVPLFVINEWHHPSPFIQPRILLKPNFAFGVLMLCGLVIIGLSSGLLPSQFLGEVQGYRPAQSIPVTLLVSLPPLLLLPLTAFLLDFEAVDPRWFTVGGLILIGTASLIDSHANPDWIRHNFYLGQIVAVCGQSMVVVSLLMLATGVVAPQEGPYASSAINLARALAVPIGTGLLDLFYRIRLNIHSNALLDRVGALRYQLAESTSLSGHSAAALQALNRVHGTGALGALASEINTQARVLAFADEWRLMAVLSFGLLLICVMPRRVKPPRLAGVPGAD